MNFKDYNRLSFIGKVKYHIRKYKERAFDEKRFQEAFRYVLTHEDHLDSLSRVAFDDLTREILKGDKKPRSEKEWRALGKKLKRIKE